MEDKINNQPYHLTWLPKKTFEILVTIPWEKVSEAKKKALSQAAKSIEVKGFRKGKAPEKVVAESLGAQKILELTLEQFIGESYQQSLSALGVRPIISPKIELVSAKENETWQIKFTACEEPEIKLSDYKDTLKKELASDKIWTPEKGLDPKKKEAKEDPEVKRSEKLQKALDWLIANVKVEVSDLLLENEVARKLSELLEQTQKLGLTVDQYLSSTGKTAESIKEEYRRQAQNNLAVEFILRAIAEAEKIAVSPEEIDKAVSEAKTEEEKKALTARKYLLAGLLRQQKTLDFLTNL